jgi:hypothetical protein
VSHPILTHGHRPSTQFAKSGLDTPFTTWALYFQERRLRRNPQTTLSSRKLACSYLGLSRRCSKRVMCAMATNGTKKQGISANGRRCMSAVLIEEGNPAHI